MQLVTFSNWRKHAYGNATAFKKLGLKRILLLTAGGAVLWFLMWVFFSLFHSSYLFFDNTITLIGIASTILCALAYIEYTFLQIIGLGIGIVLYAIMMQEKAIQITYIIYNIYALICSVRAMFKMNWIYKQQKAGEKEELA